MLPGMVDSTNRKPFGKCSRFLHVAFTSCSRSLFFHFRQRPLIGLACFFFISKKPDVILFAIHLNLCLPLICNIAPTYANKLGCCFTFSPFLAIVCILPTCYQP